MLSDHSEWEAHTKIVRDNVETDLGDFILKVLCSEEWEGGKSTLDNEKRGKRNIW